MELVIAPPHAASRAHVARQVLVRVLLVVLVFVVALVVRLRAVERLSVDFDEDDYLRAGQIYAQHLAANDWVAISNERENYEHPPLTKLVYGGLLLAEGPLAYTTPVTAQVGGTSPRPADLPAIEAGVQPLRTFSAVVGALTAGLLALVNPLAGLLLALSSWHIKYTSQAMLEALPCLFATLCMLSLRASRRNGDLRFWLAAVALGLTAAGTYRYAAGGFAAVAWIVWRGIGNWRQPLADPAALRRTLAYAAGFGTLALVIFYLFNPALWPDPLGRLRASIGFNATYASGDQVASAGFPWFQPLLWLLSGLPWNPGAVPLRLDGLFGLGALLAIPMLWRAPAPLRLVGWWLLANLLFLLLWPTKWPQYVLGMQPAAAFALALWLPQQLVTWRHQRQQRPRSAHQWRQAWPWLAPTALIGLVVALYPLLLQLGMAMSQVQALNIREGQLSFWQAFVRGALTLPPMASNDLPYVGLGSFAFVGQLVGPLSFNLLWVATTITLASGLGLWLANLLNRPGLRGRTAWRTLFILPWAIPEFVGALIWNTIFDQNFGALNNLLGQQIGWVSDPNPLLDLRPIFAPVVAFFSQIGLLPLAETLTLVATILSPPLAFWVVTLVGVWICFPFMLLVSSAALHSVSPEILEAAQVDGASGWTLWRHMTWPLIAPALLTGALLRGILLFNAFMIPQLVVGEGNLERVRTITLALIGYFGTRYSDYSFAALINTLILIVVGSLIAIVVRRSRALDEGTVL